MKALFSAVALLGTAVTCLPQVDLGYAIHEAIRYNETSGLYTFTNIRYGQAPVGELRFKAPLAPTGRNTTVQRGAAPRVCPQGSPSWGIASTEFGERWVKGQLEGFNYTEAHANELPVLRALSQQLINIPGLSEDCLFLDVTVPKTIFDGGKRKKAPVFVWFPGGGYVLGWKDNTAVSGDPSGLIAASQRDGSDGFIFVTINYRLGAFGWLAGETLKAAGGTPNAGLHDQRLALEWVKKNIHLFGGDPKQVTVGGLSAGGGSIEHHVTAYGGKKSAPFSRAFSNSPGYLPLLPENAENITETFLGYLNVSTIEEARQLPSQQLINANAEYILSSTTNYIFGPAVDGDYVPDLPFKLLDEGRFDKKVELLISYMRYEGGTYVAPWVVDDSDFDEYLQIIQPSMSLAERQRVFQLYPGPDAARTVHFAGDFVFACNADYLAQALSGRAYLYEFAVSPAFHANDLRWTFNGGVVPSFGNDVIKPQVDQLQGYIVNFIKKGNPNGSGLPAFPRYGKNASTNVISEQGISTTRSSKNNEKCRFFQKKLYE